MSPKSVDNTHAAIRFYSDPGAKISIIPVDDIENFDVENCTNQPYYIKRYDNENKCKFHLSPAEVLSAGSKEQLANNSQRYKKKKIRRSDALHLLQLKAKNGTNQPKKNPKVVKAKLKKLAQKKDGKMLLKKFMNSRNTLCVSSESEEEDRCSMEGDKCTMQEARSSMQEDRSSMQGDTSPIRQHRSPSQENRSPIREHRSPIQENRSPIQEHRSPIQENRSPIREHRSPIEENRTPIQENRTPTQEDGSISSPNNPRTPNFQNNAGNETPRNHNRRYRRLCLYTAKFRGQAIQGEDEELFNNRLQPDAQDVNAENRQLYDIVGDEIYIGCNTMIQVAFWEYIKHRGYSIFLRELLSIFWSKRDLVNRCFKTAKILTEIENRSPRKVFSPAKYRNLKQLFKDYLDETYGHSSKKKKIMKNINRLIGYKIRDIRKLDYEKIPYEV